MDTIKVTTQKEDRSIDKIIFQNEECYVAYKGLKENLKNFQSNFKYEPGHWYRSLGVNMSNKECGYGLNLTTNWRKALEFGHRVFTAYVPIKDNKIKFIGNKDKFRCQVFYLGEEIDLIEYWDELTGQQKCLLCKYNKRLDIDKHWPELTEGQKNLICEHNPNINVDKYWHELTEIQRDFICINNENFDYIKYWSELTEYQKNMICKYNKKLNIAKYCFEFWPELADKQRRILYKRVVLKSKERPKNLSW